MEKTAAQTSNQQWLRLLGKGMVTIPKSWRENLGLQSGDIVRAQKKGQTIIIAPLNTHLANYTDFNASDLKNLEESSLEDYLTQKEYQPSEDEIAYYQRIAKA